MSLVVRGLSKSFSGSEVLRGVDLSVLDGEIHALVGANGAGKSTLIKCVSGALRPDSGSIELGGHTHKAFTPREAHRAGVAVVYQDLSLAPVLSVYENVFLGQEMARAGAVRRRAERDETTRLLAKLGTEVLATTKIEDLSPSAQQSVEIVKALRMQPRVLILDEPTAALSEEEARALGSVLFELKRSGIAVLYITHRLGEVFDFADCVTVLRDGKVALSARVSEVNRTTLVEAMVGASDASSDLKIATERDQEVAPSKPAGGVTVETSAALSLSGLTAPGIGPMDLEVARGEIVGVFGLGGSGRTELVEAIVGATPLLGGEVRLNGRVVRLHRPARAVAAGVVLIPSDRLRNSLFPPIDCSDNLLLPRMATLGSVFWRRRRRERRVFAEAVQRLRIKPGLPRIPAGQLSGGNQQKLVVGRWLGEGVSTEALLLDEPTEGVDVGARQELYGILRRLAHSDNKAVIVTSSDTGELSTIADRVVVLARGRVAGILRGKEITETDLLDLAHGENPALHDASPRLSEVNNNH
jgi:ribose transport system ATP-binding protein